MIVSGRLGGMMWRNLDLETYFKVVMATVDKELTGCDHDVLIVYDWKSASDTLAIMLIIDGLPVSFNISKIDVAFRRLQNPFAVDWLIRKKITEQGIPFKNSYMHKQRGVNVTKSH